MLFSQSLFCMKSNNIELIDSIKFRGKYEIDKLFCIPNNQGFITRSENFFTIRDLAFKELAEGFSDIFIEGDFEDCINIVFNLPSEFVVIERFEKNKRMRYVKTFYTYDWGKQNLQERRRDAYFAQQCYSLGQHGFFSLDQNDNGESEIVILYDESSCGCKEPFLNFCCCSKDRHGNFYPKFSKHPTLPLLIVNKKNEREGVDVWRFDTSKFISNIKVKSSCFAWHSEYSLFALADTQGISLWHVDICKSNTIKCVGGVQFDKPKKELSCLTWGLGLEANDLYVCFHEGNKNYYVNVLRCYDIDEFKFDVQSKKEVDIEDLCTLLDDTNV